jgi:hypothetical protein
VCEKDSIEDLGWGTEVEPVSEVNEKCMNINREMTNLRREPFSIPHIKVPAKLEDA